MDIDVEPGALVRSYSEEVAERVESGAPASDLDRIIADRGKWSKYWEPSAGQQASTFNDGASKLYEAWQEFLKDLSEEERTTLTRPTFDDVIKTMQTLADNWDKKRNAGALGTAGRWYRKCCTTMKSHENLLNIIPDQSHYTSLVAGVLKTIISATARHEKVAKFFAEAISEIGDVVFNCEEAVFLYPTDQMQKLLMDMYIEIFAFLKVVIGWYRSKAWKRGLQAMNDNIIDQFREPLDGIKRCGENLKEGMSRGQAGETRYMRLIIETLVQREQRMSIDYRRKEERWAELERERLMERSVHEDRQQDLTAIIQSAVFDVLTSQASQALLQPAIVEIARSRSGSPLQPQTHTYRREELIELLNLETFFDQKRILVDHDSNNVVVPAEVEAPLRSWIKAEKSQLLAIAGPEMSFNACTTQLAASMVDFAHQAKIPVISYFSYLDSIDNARKKALMAMLCALISQCLDLWPSEVESAFEFTRPKKPEDAALLLKHVLDHVPKILYCVIDAFELLEQSTLENVLKSVVKILRKKKMVLKVLITTSGRSRTLVGSLRPGEMVVLDQQRSWITGPALITA